MRYELIPIIPNLSALTDGARARLRSSSAVHLSEVGSKLTVKASDYHSAHDLADAWLCDAFLKAGLPQPISRCYEQVS
jgi:hypothetical protein